MCPSSFIHCPRDHPDEQQMLVLPPTPRLLRLPGRIKQQENDLKYGVVSINEVRSERGLPPVPWGDVPWLPDRWLPTDEPRGAGGGAVDSPGPDQ
jgi:hypothetical protein